MLFVKVLLQDQLSVPRDEKTVKLRRVRRIHRHVENALDELLHRCAIDVLRIQRAHRPAVVARERRTVRVTARLFAARVERAVVRVANEVVASAARGKKEGDHLVLGLIRPARDLLLLSAAFPDELQRVAVAREPFHALLRAEIELRIAQDGAERAIRLRLEEEVKGERVLRRIDVAAPSIRTVGLQHDGRCADWRCPPCAVHRRAKSQPVAADHAVVVGFSAERPAVRQRERELAVRGADRQDPAGHVGGPCSGRCSAAPLQHERAARIGTESLLRFPESRQLIRGAGGVGQERMRCGDEQQGEHDRGDAGGPTVAEDRRGVFHLSNVAPRPPRCLVRGSRFVFC